MKPAGDERTPDGGEVEARTPAREQLVTVHRMDHAGAVVLVVDGAVDLITAPRLRSAIAEAFDDLGERPLVIDLSSVRLLGSPGLRALADAAREAAKHNGSAPLRIVVDQNRPVIRPIEIVGLDGALALYNDIDEAVRDEAGR